MSRRHENLRIKSEALMENSESKVRMEVLTTQSHGTMLARFLDLFLYVKGKAKTLAGLPKAVKGCGFGSSVLFLQSLK